MSFRSRSFTREEAEDLVEAVHRAGGKGSMYGPMSTGSYGVSIRCLPDVGRFLRAVASVGIHEPLYFSAGSGWHIAEQEGDR